MPVNLGITVVCFEKRNNCSRKLLQSETMIGAVCCVLGVVFSLATGAVMAAAGCSIEEQECILGKTSIEVAVSSCLNFIPVLVCQTAAGEDGYSSSGSMATGSRVQWSRSVLVACPQLILFQLTPKGLC